LSALPPLSQVPSGLRRAELVVKIKAAMIGHVTSTIVTLSRDIGRNPRFANPDVHSI
jgi:hypothetical protein